MDIELATLQKKVEFDPDHKWGYELRLVNEKEYCGKLLVLENDESSSKHYHRDKKETFIVLAGKVKINGHYDVDTHCFGVGDVLTILPYREHQFTAIDATALLLEVSTHHEDSDTYRVNVLDKHPHDDSVKL